MDTNLQRGIVYAVHIIGYMCQPCKNVRSDDVIKDLELIKKQAAELTELTRSVLELKNKLDELPTDGILFLHKSVTDKVLEQVFKEVGEKDCRRCNIVVSGIGETGSAAGDAAVFTTFCSKYLNFTPECVVNRTRRIEWKSAVGNHVMPRRLIVALSSEVARFSVLSRAPLLRKVNNDNINATVFINPDLTKAEADMAYHRRKALRERRQQGTHLQPSLDGRDKHADLNQNNNPRLSMSLRHPAPSGPRTTM